MSAKPDPVKKRFAPLQDKTLKNALAHRLGKEFPRLGGPRILALCADLILEVIQAHVRPLQHIQHGQVLWLAFDIDDPPSRLKRTADSDLIPVVLELSTADDVQKRIDRVTKGKRLLQKALRLCQQAHSQGGLLSNCDLAEMLHVNDSTVASLLSAYEQETGQVIPRRATLHDVGSGLTHKRIILTKRYRDGKPADLIARETYHSLEAVDRYIGQYDRVRHCRLQGMTPQATAYTLNCSLSLVQEYISIDLALETPSTAEKETLS